MAKLQNGIELISELVENARLFDSSGYSVVKVTKEGEEKFLRLPIKSAGVAEYQTELSQKAPRPPIIKKLIRADSDEGRELGIQADAVKMVFDTTDEVYVDAMEKHNEDYLWRIAVFALNLTWKKVDGTVAESFEERKKILQSNGITGHQRNQIYQDVAELTKIAEGREDFLSES